MNVFFWVAHVFRVLLETAHGTGVHILLSWLCVGEVWDSDPLLLPVLHYNELLLLMGSVVGMCWLFRADGRQEKTWKPLV